MTLTPTTIATIGILASMLAYLAGCVSGWRFSLKSEPESPERSVLVSGVDDTWTLFSAEESESGWIVHTRHWNDATRAIVVILNEDGTCEGGGPNRKWRKFEGWETGTGANGKPGSESELAGDSLR